VPNLRRLGAEAEDRAAEYLSGLGYTLITRRRKMRHGELDLIALDGDVLVFVEVKQRAAPGYTPEESIGESKLRALCLAAEEYVREMGEEERECRFDLIAIDRSGLRHYPDVWRG
jgi:putative endonuclease